jgi:sugar phosphate permease
MTQTQRKIMREGATGAASAHQRRWWTLGVLILAVFMVGLDNTVLNVALPTLVRDLNASTSQLQWIVAAYSLAFAGLLLTAGSLGDRFGRKGALSLGQLVFGAGSALSAYAPSADLLIAPGPCSAWAPPSSSRPPCRSSPMSSPTPSGPKRSGSGRPAPRCRSRPGRPLVAGCSATTGGGRCS